jgi:hypothetical protein
MKSIIAETLSSTHKPVTIFLKFEVEADALPGS